MEREIEGKTEGGIEREIKGCNSMHAKWSILFALVHKGYGGGYEGLTL